MTAGKMQINPSLIRPQYEFLTLKEKFKLYIGGFGSGKTWSGATSAAGFAWSHPGLNQGYFGPTYSSIKDVYFPTIDEAAYSCGLSTIIRRGDMEVDLYNGRRYRSTIICRSMKIPESIVGFKIARAHVDEIDTIRRNNADVAWRNIIARMRLGYDGINDINVTTTPEGFGFAYDTFVKQCRDNADKAALHGMVQASTYENEMHLPDDYISSLKTTYTANLIEAYLLGRFVNLTQGAVYREFDRKLNGSKETIQGHEPLFIGMDFNVGRMAAVVNVKRDGNPHAVDELINHLDTPAMITAIKERYWTYLDGNYQRTHQIRIYPDSSGGSRKSVEASTSDIQLLKTAGFIVSAPAANPPVKDRVNSMNAMICNAQNERRFKVNCDKCPTLAENLEQQAYNERGEPDKSSNMDHTNDAQGYFMHREYPLNRPATRINIGVAM